MILAFLEMLGQTVEPYEQNNEDGAYTLFDHKMEDYFPVKN
jgi:hypothetical protein